MERADADHPDAVLLIEGGEAALLQGGQQAVGGGGRKSDRLGEVGEGHAVSLGEALENRQCTIERLHLPALGCCPACPDLASGALAPVPRLEDRKSTRLNSSH